MQNLDCPSAQARREVFGPRYPKGFGYLTIEEWELKDHIYHGLLDLSSQRLGLWTFWVLYVERVLGPSALVFGYRDPQGNRGDLLHSPEGTPRKPGRKPKDTVSSMHRPVRCVETLGAASPKDHSALGLPTKDP